MKKIFTFLWLLILLTSSSFSMATSENREYWIKSYGSPNFDEDASSITVALGGDIILVSSIFSTTSNRDIVVFRLDKYGNVKWGRMYQGPGDDVIQAIAVTPTGYIVLAGYTTSFGDHSADVLTFLLDPDGNIKWQRVYGGSNYDAANAVAITPEGNIVVGGVTRSFGHGMTDIYILNLDTAGNVVWQRVYGGKDVDELYSLCVTPDNSILAAGTTSSYGAGWFDGLLLKIDSSTGEVLWTRTYGDSGENKITSIKEHGGYLYTAGISYSDYFGIFVNNAWLMKLTSSGDILWSKIYGNTTYNILLNDIDIVSEDIVLVGDISSFSSPYNASTIYLDLDLNGKVKTVLGYRTGSGKEIIGTNNMESLILTTSKRLSTWGQDLVLIKSPLLEDAPVYDLCTNVELISRDSTMKTFYVPIDSYKPNLHVLPVNLTSKNYEYQIGIEYLPISHLSVISDPNNALVYINGSYYGATPIDLLLEPGNYILGVRKTGYLRYTRVISLEDGESKTLYVNLTPSVGYLNITSIPEDAEIYIDDEYVGKTPLHGYKTSPGIHNIIIRKKGYIEYITDINITPGNTVEISAILHENNSFLNVFSVPSGAKVYTNGTYQGITPLTLKLSPGMYAVEVIKEDYEKYTISIALTEGENKTLNVTLTPLFGFLTVTSNILGAEVYVDNQKIGITPIERYKLSTGTYELRVLNEWCPPYFQNITISPGEGVKVDANLSPVYALVSVYSNIQNADVYLDEKRIGKTPLGEYKLLAGNHTIEVKADGYKAFSQNITAEPTKTLTINATLIPLVIQTTDMYSQQQTSLQSHLAQFYSPATLSYLPYIGASIFGFLVLMLIITGKRKKKSQVLDFPYPLLKKYEPLEFLGEGGFAKVFKVKRKKDKKIIALKVFPTGERAKKFFTKEVRAWKLLDHPNIVKLYNAFDEPVPHLEIEFIEGYTLDGKLIRDLDSYPKPVNEELALRFIEGIAEGLRHAHARQVYHRDLKPSNILLKSDLTPKITDFGLAKVGSKSTTTTTKALTPLYAAPEQIDEKTYGHTDHRTDIYQLGVILYELLTGKLPYEGSSHVVVLAKITNPEIKPKPPSMYNLTLAKYDKMFEKLLAKQKEKRYQSLDEFLWEFRGLVELLKEREKLKESLRVTKETITKTIDELEVKKLNSELLRLLIQNTILSARINDKEEVLNALYDLMPFTKKHRAELEEAIRQVQLFIQEGLVIPEEFIDSLRILLHKIEKET